MPPATTAPTGPSQPPRGWGAGLSPFEQLGAIFAVLLLVVGGLVWTTTKLSVRLWSGTWPDLPAAQAAAAVVRLVQQPGNPAAAFAPPLDQLVPGPLAFWVTFAAILGVAATGVVLVLRRRLGKRAGDEPVAARWAVASDLKPLIVGRPVAGRLTLGYGPAGKLLACEPGHSLLVLGPTQSGKTSGLAIPAILEWDGPVVATSVKTDLLEHTLDQRRRRGEVWIYDPTQCADAQRRAGWSPVASCDTWQGAMRTATSLVEAAREGNITDGDFWYSSAAKLLAPLLFGAAKAGLTIDDVVRWVDTQDEDEVRLHLELAGLPQALRAAEASWGREPRLRSSIYATAENVLRAYADPDVLASAERCDIVPDKLLDGRHTLYISAPLHEQARLRPLFTTLVRTVLAAAYKRAARTGRLQPRLLLVLDEAANIAPLPDLAHLASTAAGIGIQLVTVWQDGAQIAARYGGSASTVTNNHRAKLILSGIADTATTGDIAQAIGETEVVRHSTTIDAEGRTTATQAPQTRLLASAARLRQMKPFEGILLYGHLPPTRLQLRPWFGNRRRAMTERKVDDEQPHPDHSPTLLNRNQA